MKNAPIFLIGLFAALAISFCGIVLGSHSQLGNLTPFYDDAQNQSFPQRTAGIAARGQMVYADLGCAACHTQQVRRPEFGNDQARGWGERQSVARDYIFQARPQLGASRFGPDLANLASRKPTEDALYGLLHDGSERHPSYRFLFERRPVAGEAIAHSRKPADAKADYVLVPTERARSLVAYLMSLSTSFDYPEARPVAAPKAESHAAPHDAKAAPADAKKEGEQKK